VGYRWYKGRLLSDEEYANLLAEEQNQTWYSIGMFIPIVISGFIGYVIGDGWGCFFGIVFGAIIGHILNDFFVWLVLTALGIFIIYIIYYIAK
jgi:fatty-acid desaturase